VKRGLAAVIAEAAQPPKQSRAVGRALDCFASLAMTAEGHDQEGRRFECRKLECFASLAMAASGALPATTPV
jgi:hypothetical protein